MIIIEEGTNLEDIEKGSEVYKQAMINKAETGTIYSAQIDVNTTSENEEAVSSNRNADGSIVQDDNTTTDSKYAGKYNTPEDLERAYLELQTKLGQPTTDTAPNNETVQNNNETTTDTTNQDNTTQPQLTQDDAFKALGVSKEQFDSMIKATETLARNEQLSVFGGEEKYNDMIEWGDKNLSDNQKATFDKLIASGDVNDLNFANDFISGLYEGSEDRIGNSVTPLRGNSTNSAADVYESMAQLVADQKDPRYKKDQAFRNKVMSKIGRSQL